MTTTTKRRAGACEYRARRSIWEGFVRRVFFIVERRSVVGPLVHHREEERAHLLVRVLYEHRASREVQISGSLDHLPTPAMLEQQVRGSRSNEKSNLQSREQRKVTRGWPILVQNRRASDTETVKSELRVC